MLNKMDIVVSIPVNKGSQIFGETKSLNTMTGCSQSSSPINTITKIRSEHLLLTHYHIYKILVFLNPVCRYLVLKLMVQVSLIDYIIFARCRESYFWGRVIE